LVEPPRTAVAAEIRRQRIRERHGTGHWRWYPDEMFVRLNGEMVYLEMVYLWRAVDHEGEVLESYATKTRDKSPALRFIRKTSRRHGRTAETVTDGLRSYPAPPKELSAGLHGRSCRWAKNRAENSRLPFRWREAALRRFRSMQSLGPRRGLRLLQPRTPPRLRPSLLAPSFSRPRCEEHHRGVRPARFGFAASNGDQFASN
jgi:transposase-like protein